VILVGTKAQKKQLENYYKIYEQICDDSRVPLHEIAKRTGLSRNTVSKYLKEMYDKTIMIGPFLEMKPTQTYKEYVYFMNFEDPQKIFEGLKGFPHIVDHALTFGDWNILVITNELLDFSQLIEFENVVYRGVKYCYHEPLALQTAWGESFKNINEKIQHFAHRVLDDEESKLAPALPWGPDEWKLFFAFRDNTRKNITSILRKIGVSYDVYRKWLKDVETYCTTHTGFYPQGYQTYQHHCLLVSTRYKKSVNSLLSLFPTTSVFMEVSDHVLVIVDVMYSCVIRNLICIVYDMDTIKMIRELRKAQIISECHHNLGVCSSICSSKVAGKR
jgi:DNA-binding Lrp family transcriptional regulator